MPTSRASAVRAFSPPESSSTFCSFLPGRRGHDFEAALGLIFSISQTQEGLPAVEEAREDVGEVLVDAREGLVELGARDLIDLLDGLLRVLDGLDQVVALRFEEGVAVGGLLVLIQRHHVDGAHLLHALTESAARLFFGGEHLAVNAGIRRRREARRLRR